MYIGKLGDGSAYDDGIYVLLKEVVDNSIDEFVMGAGRTIDINVSELKVSVRDYGRDIPIGSVVDVVSKINTGGKYDSKAFQKSVGLNGVGTKAVNALSGSFTVQSYRASLVWLPSSARVTPRRPCEVITNRSLPQAVAVSMMPSAA